MKKTKSRKNSKSKGPNLFIILAVLAGFLFGVWYWFSDKYVVPVLMYHNIAESPTFRDDTISPKNFDWQMNFLKTHGYQVISLTELVDGIKEGRKFPHNCVAITADDGNKNNFTEAFPILKKYQLPANFFVSPGTVGEEGSMTWSDIITMHKSGMSFGSHGMIQAYLPDVSPKEQHYEIQESKKILEAKLGEKIKFYAYPVGGFNEEIKELLRQSGYEAAFTTNRGTDKFEHDVFELNRIRVGDRDASAITFGAKISGYYNFFRKLKKANG